MAKQTIITVKKFSLAAASLVMILSMGIMPITTYAASDLDIDNTYDDSLGINELSDVVSNFLNFDTNTQDNNENERVRKVEKFFKDREMPAYKYAAEFVKYADMYDIDWTLIPAIATIESTGFRNSCKKAKFSGLGWGSCKVNFSSYEESIKKVTWNLAGKNPKTERHYGDKTVPQILEAYNPAHIRPDYIPIVTKYMTQIKNTDVKQKLAEV